MTTSKDLRWFKLDRLGMGLAFTMLFALAAGNVQAQERQGGGEQLSPEDAKAAWRIQAIAVVREIGIERPQGEKAVEAYMAARESHQKARDELFSGEDGRRNFSAYRELLEKERGKLETALKEVLTDEQVGKVLPLLGSFNRQWDYLVHALSGFEIERGDKRSALNLINGYVAVYNKVIAQAIESRDFQSARTPLEKAKEELDKGMAAFLPEEQLAKWKETTAYRGRRGSR